MTNLAAIDVIDLVAACAVCPPGQIQSVMVAECVRQLEVRHFDITLRMQTASPGDASIQLTKIASELEQDITRLKNLPITKQGGPRAQQDSPATDPPKNNDQS